MNLLEIANRPQQINFIKSNSDDYWLNTPFELYKTLTSQNKGAYGENLVSEILKDLGFDIKDRTNSGHDRIVNEIKTEIKFSLATSDYKKRKIKKNSFIINHVAIGKDWNRLIFLGINGPSTFDYKLIWFTKDDFKYMIENKLFFRKQQGGKDGGNDDYMCSGKNILELINSIYVKNITEW